MASHSAENTGQRSNFDRIMIGNRDVVLSAFAGGQAQMAAALPRDRIAQLSERPRQFSAGNISWQFHFTQATESKASHGDDFFPDKMQSDDLGRLPFLKMAFDSITDLLAQRVHRLGFSKNGVTERASGISAFRRFFD